MPEPVRRRRTLPGAQELFRPTGASAPAEPDVSAGAQSSGRVRHDEKITVYFSSDELFALEDARLDLRRHHRISVDRGRIVRAAVALALADLAEKGTSSALFQHLDS